MVIIKNIVISAEAPSLKEVGWLQPVEDGAFRLKFYGPAGWVDAASGVKGAKGDDGKSITAISLTTNEAGQVTGGNATLSDGSSVPITVNQS